MGRFTNRVVSIVALAAATLLVVTAVLGLVALWGGSRGPERRFAAHGWAGLAAAAGVLGAAGLGAAHGRRARATCRNAGLPGWIAAQADKAARRTDPVRLAAAILMLLAVGVGLAARGSEAAGLGHVGLGAAAATFGLGTVAAEALSVVALGRMGREAASRARQASGSSGLDQPPARDTPA